MTLELENLPEPRRSETLPKEPRPDDQPPIPARSSDEEYEESFSAPPSKSSSGSPSPPRTPSGLGTTTIPCAVSLSSTSHRPFLGSAHPRVAASAWSRSPIPLAPRSSHRSVFCSSTSGNAAAFRPSR